LGPNAAFPHHQTGGRLLGEGDVAVADIGVRKGTSRSDILRMAVVGHKPDGYDKIRAIVEHAARAALDVVRPGAGAQEVDSAARGVIAEAGL